VAVILEGPASAGQLGFCVLCAASYKQDTLTEIGDEVINAARADDSARPISLRATARHKNGGVPASAVAYGLVLLPIPGLGQQVPCPAPLCWTHLQAINVIDTAVALATASDLPGGAVDLSQRRRG
jgi:hypothetical protein